MSDPTITPSTDTATTTVPDPTPVPAATPRGPWSVLRRGPFARYAGGDAVSMIGYWMQATVQSIVMTNLTDKAIWLGMVNFAGSVPMLALTIYGGATADRLDKRKIIIACQCVQIILALAVGWLVAAGHVEIWHILAAAVLLGVSASFEMPATAALVPEMVDQDEIASAMAIDRSIFHGTRLIGPAVAGFVIGKMGNASAFYINAATFLASIAAIASVLPRRRGTDAEEQERQGDMWAGVSFVRQDRPTLAMLALMAAGSLCVFPFMAVMMPLFGKDTLGLDKEHIGYLMSFSGVGSLVASFGVVAVSRPRRNAWLAAGAVDIVLSLIGLGLARNFWQACLALTTLGLGTSFNYGIANTTVQERAPGPLRGRVSALAMMSFIGVMPFASVGVTALADWIGFRTAMVVGAVAYGVASLFVVAGAGRRSTELPVEQTAAVPAQGAT